MANKPSIQSKQFRNWIDKMKQLQPELISTLTDEELYQDYFN